MNSERLYHITTAAEANAARQRGEYRPAAFDREGFIHCSYDRQVVATANRIFRGRDDLVLLEIDPRQLTCRVVDENLEGGNELYPHIYGPLAMQAVSAVHPFPPETGGTFSLPATLARNADLTRSALPPT
jgi:uncharacterized protein (DUF952 family)